VVLGIASAIGFKRKQNFFGTLTGLFAVLAIGIGSGLLREQ
jgi:hypothetical protein